MFIVKDNQPDVAYNITTPVVTDAEDVILDPQPALTFEVISDNPASVELISTDETSGNAHFGAPGQASVNVNVRLADGTLIGAFGAQFTVTTGDPAAISGGGISFSGLSESV